MVAGQDVALRNDRLIGVELHKCGVGCATGEIISGIIGVVIILCCAPIGGSIAVHKLSVVSAVSVRSGKAREQCVVRAAHVDG